MHVELKLRNTNKSGHLRNLKTQKGYVNIQYAKKSTRQTASRIFSKPTAHNLCYCNILILFQTIFPPCIIMALNKCSTLKQLLLFSSRMAVFQKRRKHVPPG